MSYQMVSLCYKNPLVQFLPIMECTGRESKVVMRSVPGDIEARQREEWATYYSTNSAALSHYHLEGAVPYEWPASPLPSPRVMARQEAPQELRGCISPNNRKRRKCGARERRAARDREARQAAGREERKLEAREAEFRKESGFNGRQSGQSG